MSYKISRRRFIGIAAAATGLGLLSRSQDGSARTSPAVWRGVALGAVCKMQIYHPDRAAAEELIRLSLHEVRRLERLFSLYRADSALVSLNLRGVIEAPVPEFVDLFRQALGYFELTRGAFDPTVQPLWTLYADHFVKPGASPAGPPMAAIEAALAKIGASVLMVGPDGVAFAKRGMAVTLNGIAQGYITNRWSRQTGRSRP